MAITAYLLFSVQYLSYIYHYIQEWRKNPQWSLSCCLALLLPLNELQCEVRGMAGTDLLNQQLQSGNIDMPSVSAAFQESGAVTFDLEGVESNQREDENGGEMTARKSRGEEQAIITGITNVHEGLRESNESGVVNLGSAEHATGQRKQEYADNIAVSKGKRMEQAIVTIASVHEQPRGRKKGGAVNIRFVQGATGQRKEQTANKMAVNKGREVEQAIITIASVHEQPRDTGTTRHKKEENADNTINKGKRVEQVSLTVDSVHDGPKGRNKGETVQVGLKESGSGQGEEESGDKVTINMRERVEHAIITFASTPEQEPMETNDTRL